MGIQGVILLILSVTKVSLTNRRQEVSGRNRSDQLFCMAIAFYINISLLEYNVKRISYKCIYTIIFIKILGQILTLCGEYLSMICLG